MPIHPQAQAFRDIVAAAPPLDTQTPDVNRQDLSDAVPLTGDREDVTVVEDRGRPASRGRCPATA